MDVRCNYCGEDLTHDDDALCCECAKLKCAEFTLRVNAANYEMRRLLLRIIDRDDVADILHAGDQQLHAEICAIVYGGYNEERRTSETDPYPKPSFCDGCQADRPLFLYGGVEWLCEECIRESER